ncbi:MAG TPA: TetR/AcrR family transcriptional regulator [Cellvibrionaceae bacterium]|nr:TetR/AcrR family transcriptional regulator [Cellvibrionaceae bacterium]HNG61335.1 TetR/AcrR family transcriptional regulator [Cellvibrionaceae bacterium]
MSQADTRTLLLDTALALIWRSNYDSVGVNEICKQAGVTKGSFYHHFESKLELFFEASNHYWETIRKDLDGLLSPINPPLEQLAKWITFIFINKVGKDEENIPGCAFFSACMQIGAGDPRIISSLQAMLERGATYNRALIQNLHNGNYLDDEVNCEQKARLMQQFVHGAITYVRASKNIANLKSDLPKGIFRLIGLKKEYWEAVESQIAI